MAEAVGIFDFWKKSSKNDSADISRLELEDLQCGYLFDYDMKTWQVTAAHNYTYGEGHTACEWEIAHSDIKRFLMCNSGDEVTYCLGEKINLREISPAVRETIIKTEDPPSVVTYRNKKYHLEESGTGLFYRDKKEQATEFIYWELIDEKDTSFISLEQWGETDFTASLASWVESYQFTNILPFDLNKGRT